MDSSLPGSGSMGFSRQEYWSGMPFPSPGHLPNPGIEPGSPALQTVSLLSEPHNLNPNPNKISVITVESSQLCLVLFCCCFSCYLYLAMLITEERRLLSWTTVCQGQLWDWRCGQVLLDGRRPKEDGKVLVERGMVRLQ